MTDGRPVLVYDDDCGFCTWSAAFVVRHGADVDLVGFSELADEQRARLPADWRDCAHLLTDVEVYSCGAAMEQAMARTRLVPAGLFAILDLIPGYPGLRERGYRFVADHRSWFGRFVER